MRICWVMVSAVLPRGCVVIGLPLRSLIELMRSVGGHEHLEVLRIQRRHVADVLVRLVEGRGAGERVDGRDRVAEADLGLALLDAAHVGDAGARHGLHREAGDGLLPHVLELAAERHPHAALRAGHQPHRLGLGASADNRAGERGEQGARQCPPCDGSHGFPPMSFGEDASSSLGRHERSRSGPICNGAIGARKAPRPNGRLAKS